MEMVPISPERKAQLDDYAHRHGQNTAAALDEALADYLKWERQDYEDGKPVRPLARRCCATFSLFARAI